MKYQIIVVSDSHGDIDILDKIKEKYPNAMYYLHAGDSERREEEIQPFISVRGNCDYYIKKEFLEITCNNKKIYVYHGHKRLLLKSLLASYAKKAGYDIFIYGHTHIPFYEVIDGVHIICPGSLNYPRSKSGKTFVIINLDKENIEVNFEHID